MPSQYSTLATHPPSSSASSSSSSSSSSTSSTSSISSSPSTSSSSPPSSSSTSTSPSTLSTKNKTKLRPSSSLPPPIPLPLPLPLPIPIPTNNDSSSNNNNINNINNNNISNKNNNTNSISALGKTLQIQIDSFDSSNDIQPYPRTPTPTPSMKIPSIPYLNSYPAPPPFPPTPRFISNKTIKTPRALNIRPTRRTVLYRTENALASIEKETLANEYTTNIQTLETMGDVYSARLLGFREDNLNRALLSLKFAKRLLKHKPDCRDYARICIKIGRTLFDLCNIKLHSNNQNVHLNFLTLSKSNLIQIQSALSLVDYGLDSYTKKPEWCDRPKDARAYVSGFVCRGYIFDSLYRSIPGLSSSASPSMISSAHVRSVSVKSLRLSSTWDGDLHNKNNNITNSNNINGFSSSMHRRTRSYTVESSELKRAYYEEDGNEENDTENDINVNAMIEKDILEKQQKNKQNKKKKMFQTIENDEDRIMKGETNKIKRKTYLHECKRSLELALSAGTDMINIRSTPLSSPTTATPTTNSNNNDENQVIQRCRVAVEGIERLKVILSLCRAYYTLNIEDDESGAGSGGKSDDRRVKKNNEKIKCLINSVLDTPFSPRVCNLVDSNNSNSNSNNNYKSDVYLCVDCNEVTKLKDELKMINEILMSPSNASLTRCTIC